MSHSILYALLRNFLVLICHTGNGLKVGGDDFFLSGNLQDRMDSFIRTLQFPSGYNRRPPQLRG